MPSKVAGVIDAPLDMFGTAKKKLSAFMAVSMPNRSSIVRRYFIPRRACRKVRIPRQWGIREIVPHGRRAVTVCIAVGCDCEIAGKKPKIIFVSDLLLSVGFTSSESTIKVRRLAKGWTIMFAGRDVSHAPSVIHTAGIKLEGQDKTGAFQAATAIAESYQLVRRVQLENKFLGTYGMNMKEFLSQGRKIFPESHYLNLIYEMERYDLGCQFLVAGFGSDEAKFPSFFTVSNPGEFSPLDDIGYGAIGSGDANAISYLARRNQDEYQSCERSLYTAIAAKHLAEKAEGVGKQTFVVVAECGNDTPCFLDEPSIEEISKMWRDEEQNIMPKDLEQRISRLGVNSKAAGM